MKIDYYQDFMTHRRNAKRRNIDFNLTYEQWLNIWETSGKLDQKGKGQGKYVMCRYGDVGPYSINNVYIHTQEHNGFYANYGKKQKTQHSAKISKALTGKTKSSEAIKNNAQAQLLRPKYNCPHCNKLISGMGNVKQHITSKHGIAA